METILITVENTEQAVKAANKARLANKNQWYQLKFIKGHEEVGLKCYGTWIQLCTKPLFSTAMDQTPTQFKDNIRKGIEKL